MQYMIIFNPSLIGLTIILLTVFLFKTICIGKHLQGSDILDDFLQKYDF
jgi:hypothetical protein